MTTIAKVLPDYDVEVVEYDGETLLMELGTDEYPDLHGEELQYWAEEHGYVHQGGLVYKKSDIPIEHDAWYESVRETLEFDHPEIKWGSIISVDIDEWVDGWYPAVIIEKLP